MLFHMVFQEQMTFPNAGVAKGDRHFRISTENLPETKV